jgi:hypothetical protein
VLGSNVVPAGEFRGRRDKKITVAVIHRDGLCWLVNHDLPHGSRLRCLGATVSTTTPLTVMLHAMPATRPAIPLGQLGFLLVGERGVELLSHRPHRANGLQAGGQSSFKARKSLRRRRLRRAGSVGGAFRAWRARCLDLGGTSSQRGLELIEGRFLCVRRLQTVLEPNRHYVSHLGPAATAHRAAVGEESELATMAATAMPAVAAKAAVPMSRGGNHAANYGCERQAANDQFPCSRHDFHSYETGAVPRFSRRLR